MKYYVDRMCDFPKLENMDCYTISNNTFKYESNLFTHTGYTLLNNFNSTNPTSSNWNRYYYYDINGNVGYEHGTTNYKFYIKLKSPTL